MTGVLESIRIARNTGRHLQALRRAASSDTCVIVGNGPSLLPETVAAIDFGLADVYISNFAYENPELFGRANVLGIVNPLVMEQAVDGLAETFSAARADGKSTPLLLLPLSLAGQVSNLDYAIGVATAPTPGFQTDHVLGASTQSTVTYFLLQVAFWVGYKRVTLIGVDNTYDQPSVAEGVVIEQVDADANHFSSDYFRGRYWQAADTSRMAAVISMAATTYNAFGRLLTNSTVGGALEILPRVPLDEVLDRARPDATPIGLSLGRLLGLRLWSLLLHLRSRWALGVALLVAAVLSIVSLTLRFSASDSLWSELAMLGVGLSVLFATVIVAISLRARSIEVASQHTFERLSREAMSPQNMQMEGRSPNTTTQNCSEQD